MRVAPAALTAALVLAPAALASPGTSAQVRTLALAAQHEPAALQRLESIDSVDGRPVDMAALIGNAHGADLRARLETLAAGGVAGSATPRTRDEARQILRQRRFRGSPVPRPFHGVLVALGNAIHRLLTPFRRIGFRGPRAGGGWSWAWGLVALAIVGIAALVVLRLGRRRGGLQIVSGGGPGGRAGEDDPARLERSADEAERAGDLAAALRLRFRAGLLRLARKRVIPARSSVATREVRAAVRSAEFDELARAFDEIVYGHRDARPDDLDRARAAWPHVVDSAGSSR